MKKIEPGIIPVAPVHGEHSRISSTSLLKKFEQLRRVAEQRGGTVVDTLTSEEIDMIILALKPQW